MIKKLSLTPSVCFLGRFPEAQDRTDGYFQRVAAMDEALAEGLVRVYLRTDGPVTQVMPLVKRLANDLFEVRISRRNPFHRAAARRTVLSCSAVYAHSILAIESPLAFGLWNSGKKRILDLHGAVPEEAEMRGSSERAALLAPIEREAMHRADIVLGVTSQLLEHVATKWGSRNDQFRLVIPIVAHVAPAEQEYREPNSVIYAGGFQAWQQMPKMLQFVHDHPELTFTFLTPEPDRVRQLYSATYGTAFPGESTTCKPSDLPKWYARHRFGLILREESVVNRVASPTKLAEYMRYGVVPIVDCPTIGDFASLGYRYVEYQAWDPELPGAVEANRAVLDELDSLNKASTKVLLKTLRG